MLVYIYIINNNNNTSIVAISMVPYLTNKGEHTAHYKITKNAYIKL